MSKKLKGVSIGITNKDKTIFEYYEGVINQSGLKNAADKMMKIGSNTKLLTAFGIMQLVEQGLLLLDEDITTYVNTPLLQIDYSIKWGSVH